MWRNSRTSYGRLTRWLHWTIALLFVAQIGLGFIMEELVDPETQFSIVQWHKSLGLLILALAVSRLIWGLTNIHPSPVRSVAPLEASAARSVHWLLLSLTILVPLAGWAVVSTSTLDIPVYIFNRFAVPNLPMTASDETEAFWSEVHAFLAYGAGAIVLLHAGAALYHHAVRGDDTLRRMMGVRSHLG